PRFSGLGSPYTSEVLYESGYAFFKVWVTAPDRGVNPAVFVARSCRNRGMNDDQRGLMLLHVVVDILYEPLRPRDADIKDICLSGHRLDIPEGDLVSPCEYCGN